MDRRKLLKMIAAVGLAPAMPGMVGRTLTATATATAATSGAAATSALSPQTYLWAEMMVRAHDKCNISMLERLLQLDNAAATALRDQLLQNGVITGSKTACGMHKAVQPLYREIMPRKSLSDGLQERLFDRQEPRLSQSTEPQNTAAEVAPTHDDEASILTIDSEIESKLELVESDCEENRSSDSKSGEIQTSPYARDEA